MNAILKKCSKCKIEKDLGDFYKQKVNKDGLFSSCKICHNNQVKDWYQKNKSQRKSYYENNKLEIAKQKKLYQHNHKSKRADYVRNRHKTDPYFKLVNNLRSRTLLALKGKQKSAPTEKLLGCTFQEFNTYFKSKMTPDMSWDAYMRGEIHIDHKRPCSSFDLSDPIQQRQCFHFSNLQPLWAKDNLSKHDKLDWSIK